MNITINRPLIGGTVPAPISKSEAHRALISAALSHLYRKAGGYAGEYRRPILVRCDGINEDITATVRCLCALGTDIRQTEDGFTVYPLRAGDIPESPCLDCGESGSTLRFLLPVAAALCGMKGAPSGLSIRFIGRGRLPERPMAPLDALLTAHGIIFTQETDGKNLPVILSGTLTPGEYAIDGGVSSQFISGLLFALPLLETQSRLTVTGRITSAPYIGMTVHALSYVTSSICGALPCYTVDPTSTAPAIPDVIRVGGDWSGSAALLALGLLTDAPEGLLVTGLSPTTLQGDAQIVPILRRMGGDIQEVTEPQSGTCSGYLARPSKLHGISLDAEDVPDLVPVIAACAAVAEGETVITGAARLRIKESDRLAVISEILNALGCDVTVTGDGFIIRGNPSPVGGTVSAHGDHRMAFCAAVAAMKCRGPVTVCGAEAVGKSYPGFWDDLNRLTKSNKEWL